MYLLYNNTYTNKGRISCFPDSLLMCCFTYTPLFSMKEMHLVTGPGFQCGHVTVGAACGSGGRAGWLTGLSVCDCVQLCTLSGPLVRKALYKCCLFTMWPSGVCSVSPAAGDGGGDVHVGGHQSPEHRPCGQPLLWDILPGQLRQRGPRPPQTVAQRYTLVSAEAVARIEQRMTPGSSSARWLDSSVPHLSTVRASVCSVFWCKLAAMHRRGWGVIYILYTHYLKHF